MRLWAFCVPTTLTQYTGCCIEKQQCKVEGKNNKTNLKNMQYFVLGHHNNNTISRFLDCTYCFVSIPVWCVNITYRVSRSRERRPLDRSASVTSVVPEDNLSWVSATDNQVRMKLSKRSRHDRRLEEWETKIITHSFNPTGQIRRKSGFGLYNQMWNNVTIHVKTKLLRIKQVHLNFSIKTFLLQSLTMNFLKYECFGGMDFQWRNRNLSVYIKKSLNLHLYITIVDWQ